MSSNRRFKFSKKLIDELPATSPDSASRETEYSDEACTGLRLIVNRAGRKRYLLRYSIDGKKKAIQIGEHAPYDVKEARLKANELKKLISEGIDPQAERAARRAVLTLRQFAEEHYLMPWPTNVPLRATTVSSTTSTPCGPTSRSPRSASTTYND